MLGQAIQAGPAPYSGPLPKTLGGGVDYGPRHPAMGLMFIPGYYLSELLRLNLNVKQTQLLGVAVTAGLAYGLAYLLFFRGKR